MGYYVLATVQCDNDGFEEQIVCTKKLSSEERAVLNAESFPATFRNLEIVKVVRHIERAAAEQGESSQTSNNSDYAAALRVNEEWLRVVEGGYQGTFIMFTKERLNPVKAPDCA